MDLNWKIFLNSLSEILLYFISFHFLIQFLFPLIYILIKYFILVHFLSKRKKLKSFGSWAIVTGCTEGIGLAYCHALAKDGLNIFLLSLEQNDLITVANKLEKLYSIKTKTLQVDFVQTRTQYSAIAAAVKHLDVAVLVNNVGISYPPNEFACEPLHHHQRMIDCNILSGVCMTRIVLEHCSSLGAIIHLSSGSGLNYVPLFSVYSATKVFVKFFSQSLHYELHNYKHVLVQTVLPYLVATRGSRVSQSTWFTPKPTEVVESALNMLGVEKQTFGCLSHALQHLCASQLPEWLRLYCSWRIISQMRQKLSVE